MTDWSEFSFILKPSNLGGIGVFATHDIAKDTHLLRSILSPRRMMINKIPPEFIKYCVFINEEECFDPERFDRMEIGWYINHSHSPNIVKLADNYIVAACTILAGEEILIDYNQLDEPEYMKEDYYKR